MAPHCHGSRHVIGAEQEFNDSKLHECKATEYEAFPAEAEEEADTEVPLPDDVNSEDDSDGEDIAASDSKIVVSAEVKNANKKLHANTGHRSNRRLARALVIAGATPEAIQAAKRRGLQKRAGRPAYLVPDPQEIECALT